MCTKYDELASNGLSNILEWRSGYTNNSCTGVIFSPVNSNYFIGKLNFNRLQILKKGD